MSKKSSNSEAGVLGQKTTKERSHASVACDLCRKSRTRCSADNPCSRCQKIGADCTYTRGGDLRRIRTSTNDLEMYQRHQDAFKGIILELQNRAPDESVGTIRSSAAFQDALRLLFDPSSLDNLATATPVDPTASFSGEPNLHTEQNLAAEQHDDDDLTLSTPKHLQDPSTWHPSLQARWQKGEVYETTYTPQHNYSKDTSWRKLRPRNDDSADSTSVMTTHALNNVGQQSQPQTNSPSFGNLPFSSALHANGYSKAVQNRQRLNFQIPEYYLLPLIEDDGTPLSRVYTDFQKVGRGLIRDSGSLESVTGGSIAEAVGFFRPRLPHEPITAYSWGYDVNRGFAGAFPLTLHLASSVVLGRFMRWMLHPCAETYALVPEIIRPTLKQRLIPHQASMDMVIFAGVRDLFMQDTNDFVRAVHESGISFSWPHTLNEAFIFDTSTGELMVSPVFAAHLSDVRNWVVGKNFLNIFPTVKEHINMADEPYIKPEERFL